MRNMDKRQHEHCFLSAHFKFAVMPGGRDTAACRDRARTRTYCHGFSVTFPGPSQAGPGRAGRPATASGRAIPSRNCVIMGPLASPPGSGPGLRPLPRHPGRARSRVELRFGCHGAARDSLRVVLSLQLEHTDSLAADA
jgi:hypothetical protein